MHCYQYSFFFNDKYIPLHFQLEGFESVLLELMAKVRVFLRRSQLGKNWKKKIIHFSFKFFVRSFKTSKGTHSFQRPKR